MPTLTAHNDPRQMSWLTDDSDRRPDLLARIDDWIRTSCNHDARRIISTNTKLRAHYHPRLKRCQCSEELLACILRDLPDAFPIPGRPQ
jgi:hypothetical protein